MIAEPLKIEKCAKCGHDVMAKDDLVLESNPDLETFSDLLRLVEGSE